MITCNDCETCIMKSLQGPQNQLTRIPGDQLITVTTDIDKLVGIITLELRPGQNAFICPIVQRWELAAMLTVFHFFHSVFLTHILLFSAQNIRRVSFLGPGKVFFSHSFLISLTSLTRISLFLPRLSLSTISNKKSYIWRWCFHSSFSSSNILPFCSFSLCCSLESDFGAKILNLAPKSGFDVQGHGRWLA